MGITYYFYHLTKKYKKLKVNELPKNIDNYFIDFNGVIHTECSKLLNDSINSKKFTEELIIENLWDKINNYNDIYKPKKLIICTDGVAPLAKIIQQRKRRYLTIFKNNIDKIKSSWDTNAISAGTTFMDNLDEFIFNKINDNSFIFDGSKNAGEGEHKIFQYLRTIDFDKSKAIIINGLDAADLIMLSLNHLKINNKINNIYLVREAPHFNNLINDTIDINELYMLDIQKLALTIVKELDKEENMFAIHDYVFLCFLLGNDFLPSFPALNIRTGGISKLIEAYKNTMFNELVIQNGIINWKGLYNIILYLTQKEEEYIIKEYELRNKITDNLQYKNNNREEIHIDFEKIPQVEREIEKYINPCENFWKERYYKILFDININETKKKQISLNYIEGLEWTYKYYTDKCCDWRWKYNYHYPPLLEDLIKYIPI